MAVSPDKPVKCRLCGKDSGYTEQGLMHRVLPPEGLRCKSCDQVFLGERQVRWSVVGS